MTYTYSREEIIAKLKWFHGEEFEKYPLSDWLKGKDKEPKMEKLAA